MPTAASLAVLDRRCEIGVFKSLRYARWHILITLMVEYALIALVAAGAGLPLVRGLLWLVRLQKKLAASLPVLTPLAAGQPARPWPDPFHHPGCYLEIDSGLAAGRII